LRVLGQGVKSPTFRRAVLLVSSIVVGLSRGEGHYNSGMDSPAPTSTPPPDRSLSDRLVDWSLHSVGAMAATLVVAVVAAVGAYYFLRHVVTPWEATAFDHFQSWTERQSTVMSVLIVGGVSMLLVFQIAVWAYGKLATERSKPTDMRWFYGLIGGLVLVAGADLWTYVIHPSRATVEDLHRHATWYGIRLHFDTVIVLVAAGCGIYLFRRRYLIAYGFGEVVVAVLSNLALIDEIDLTRLPHIALTSTQTIEIDALVYLLSQGVSDLMDGVTAMRERWAGASGAP